MTSTFDIACPVGDCNDVAQGGTDQVYYTLQGGMATFMIDGGSTCHVLGFLDADIEASLHNIRPVSLAVVVGGNKKLQCERLADVHVKVSTSAGTPKVFLLRDVRVMPGFGINLISGPCMEKAGLTLTQTKGVFKAVNSNGAVVLTSLANDRGLYFINVDFLPCRSPDNGDPTDLNGKRRKFLTGMALPTLQTFGGIEPMGLQQGACVSFESSRHMGEGDNVRSNENVRGRTPGSSLRSTFNTSQLPSSYFNPSVVREPLLRPQGESPMWQSVVSPEGNFGDTLVDSGGGKPVQ